MTRQRTANHTDCEYRSQDEMVALPIATLYRRASMTKTAKPSALSKLKPRLKKLSEQCHDLYERDLRESKERCFRSHCQMIWERLSPAERKAIQREVNDPPLRPDTPGMFVDFACSKLIAKCLQGTHA